MAADKTTATTVLSALGFMHPALRDPAVALWREESSFTSAWSIPGTAKAQGYTELALAVTGTQSDGGQLRTRVLNAGLSGKVGLGIRSEGDARWMGWDPPHVISGWEPVLWLETGTGLTTKDPQIGRIQKTHRLGIICQRRRVLVPTYTVSFFTRTLTSSTWSSSAVYSQATAPIYGGFHPCWIELPKGELLAWHWVEDTARKNAQVRQHISRDGGATWTVASRACLPEPIDTDPSTGYTLGRLRAAVKGKEVMLVMHLKDNSGSFAHGDELRQYASKNFGGEFRLIDVTETSGASSINETGAFHDIVVHKDRFYLFYVRNNGFEAVWRSVSSVYRKFWDQDGNTIVTGGSIDWAIAGSGNLIGDGDLAAWRDDDGAIYVAGRAFDAPTPEMENDCFILRSRDGGKTWAAMGKSSIPLGSGDAGVWFSPGVSTNYPHSFSGCSWGGTQALAHNWVADPGDEDPSLGCFFLGGWTTETMPGLQLFSSDDTRAGFTQTWLPFDLPGDAGWVRTSTGTFSEILDAGELGLTVLGGAQVTYSKTPTGTPDEGYILAVRLRVTQGGSLSADDIYIRMRLAGGASVGLDVSVRFSTAGFRVYDNNGAAQVGADVLVANNEIASMSAGIEVILGMSADGFCCSYRDVTETPARRFLAGPEGALATDTEFSNEIEWGVDTSGLNSTAYWRWLLYSSDEYTGLGKATRLDDPDELFWRTLAGEKTYLDDGVQVVDTNGPGFMGDEHHIDAGSDFGVQRIWPRVRKSPRQGWRSTDDSTEMKIAWAFRQDLGAASGASPTTNIGRDALFIGLEGINWRTAFVEGYRPGVGWVPLHTIDTAQGLSNLRAVTSGAAVVPGTTGTAPFPYLFPNEFAGATFDFNTAGALRRIHSHTAGVWNPSTLANEHPVLHLDGVDGTEPASVSAARIWSTRVGVVISLRGADCVGVRLRIPAQDTVDGDLRIGTAVVGHLYVLGQRAGWGRSLQVDVSIRREELEDGTVRDEVLAPFSEVLELPFSDLQPTRQVANDTPNPDFYKLDTNAAAQPVVSRRALVAQLRALMDLLHEEGKPAEPVFFLPRIPAFTSISSRQFTRADLLFYGEVLPTLRLEGVQGDEWVNEVWRVPKLSIRRLR